MSGPGRGPTGAALLPPEWLSQSKLPILELPPGSSLVRIHHSDRSPIFFSPGPGRPPAGRFDSTRGAFGILYVAFAFEGAFAETVLRNPRLQFVSLGEINSRSLSVLGVSRSVRLVDMRGAGLQALGVDNAITSGPYEPRGIWADALFVHHDQPDGIAYPSRHDPDQVCVALFSRPDIGLDIASDAVPLTDMLSEVATVLRRYKKGLSDE
jgi:hypothetical protein